MLRFPRASLFLILALLGGGMVADVVTTYNADNYAAAQSPDVAPVPSLPIVNTTLEPLPIASIKGPAKTRGAFILTVRLPDPATARITWENIFPAVDADGAPVEPEIIKSGEPGTSLWIFNNPPNGIYLFRGLAQVSKAPPEFDTLEKFESITVVDDGTIPRPPVDPTDPTQPTDPTTPSNVTAAFYVFEKDDTVPPLEVRAALSTLNRDKKINANLVERNATKNMVIVPAQYKIALEAAKDLPSLVIMAGDKVLRQIKAPTTQQQVFDATK